MKEREIIKAVRDYLDIDLGKEGFKFNSKRGAYINTQVSSGLYFEINFLLQNVVTPGTNFTSKYLEIFLNIFHEKTSTILWETIPRGKNLDSFLFFKVAGNLLSDIVLNPDWRNYGKKNNFNYFDLTFSQEADIKIIAEKILLIIQQHAIPFFQKLSSISLLLKALDCCYNETIVIHNNNPERLLALVVFLIKSDDENKMEKINMINQHLVVTNNEDAISALVGIKKRLANL